jgi:hypothetical protein
MQWLHSPLAKSLHPPLYEKGERKENCRALRKELAESYVFSFHIYQCWFDLDSR